MPMYRVKTGQNLNSGEFQAGDVVRLSQEEAAAMPWAVELAAPMASEDPEPAAEMISPPPADDAPAGIVTTPLEEKPKKGKK